MLDIPEIFNQPHNGFAVENLPVVQEKPRWTEFVSHLSQFGELDVPSTREQLESLLAYEGDPSHRAALITGIARCTIGEGQLLEGAGLLGYAYSLLPEHDRDTRAFVLLELVAFLAIIGSYDNALMILKTVKNLTNSEYLLRIAQYYSLVNVGRKGDPSIIEALKASAEYFDHIGQKSTLAYHYKNIGNFYGKLGEYHQTDVYYQKALALVGDPRFQHIRAAIFHDMGMMEFRQGNFETSEENLSNCVSIADSYYTQSYALGNLGFIHYTRSGFTRSLAYFEQSLNIAVDHGVFHLVPGACYYLGCCAEHLHQMTLAEDYFAQGSRVALELAQQKFPLTGERLNVVNRYIAFLQDHASDSMIGSGKLDFSFAIEKTLKEIRAAFQETLLDVMIHKSGSVKNAIALLDIAERTYSKARERNRKFTPEKSHECLLVFIRQNQNLNWKDINRKFDDQILTFLYHKYHMSKKEMSQQLGVNYSRLVMRFNQIKPTEPDGIPANLKINKIEGRY